MGPLVAPSWLASRLKDPGTVVLDATLAPVGITPPVDTRSRYLDKHIPGAIFFDIEELSDHATPLPHMLPTPEAFSRSMSALGIGDNMTIVVYEQEGVFSAPRIWSRSSRTGQLPREAPSRLRQRPPATQRQHREAPADS
jgi:thiosulfate/3-mercaptopyruvate sulfurtransferase